MYSTKRYVIFAFLGLTFLLWVTLSKLLGSAAYLSDISDPPLIGAQFKYSTLIGLVVALVAGIYTYSRKDVQRFSNDVVEELMKVAWPDWKTTRSATATVVVTTLIIAAILGVFDNTWRLMTGLIYAG